MRLNCVDSELAEFCRAEYGRLVGVLSLYCRDGHLAEELAQDALVRVVDNWRQVREFGSPSAWAYRVAINLANSHLRRRLAERRATRRLAARATSPQHDPDTSTTVAVRAALARLPRRERAVIVLRFFADLPVREVSELLGYPEGTVKTLTARALATVTASVLAMPGREDPPAVAPAPIRLADLPTGWTELPAPPEVRQQAATAWTGEQLIMWGGAGPGYEATLRGNGFVFDIHEGAWRELAPSPLTARIAPAAAWTGDELLVWGGTTPSGTRRFDDGAAYDPATGTWRRLPPAPISARAPQSVWTGQELIVWGTAERRADTPRNGAAYDPATDTWRAIAQAPIALTDATSVWNGTEMTVLGAALGSLNNADTPTAIAAAYHPASDTWRRLPNSPLSPQASTAAWTGEQLVAWDYELAAAVYDPIMEEWRPLPEVPLRSSECYPDSVPLGVDVFGEYCGAMVVFDARARQWREVSLPEFAGWGGDPAARGWWFEPVPADPAVLLLGTTASAEMLLAYRP